MSSSSEPFLWKINVALTGRAEQWTPWPFHHAYMLTWVSFCVFLPSTRWMWIPAMSRQHESEYAIIEPVSKRLLLRRWATVDKICCRPWVGFISLLLGSRLKWFGPNWPERDIKAELTAHLSFREENLGHLSGGSPVSETVEGGKRNQKLEVILLVKNEIGFLKTLRGIAEEWLVTWILDAVSTGVVFYFLLDYLWNWKEASCFLANVSLNNFSFDNTSIKNLCCWNNPGIQKWSAELHFHVNW